MAFNAAAFRTRALTSVVFVAVMFAGLFINQWSFVILFSVIHIGCWLEFLKIVDQIDPRYRSVWPVSRYMNMTVGFVLIAFAPFMVPSAERPWNDDLWIPGLMIMGLLVLANVARGRVLKYYVLGFLYITLGCVAMVWLWTISYDSQPRGWTLPLILIASIWINDTMAYIVGSFIGKTPLSKISPKKTWEGTIGGALLAVATVTLGGFYLFGYKDIPLLAGFSLIGAVVGTCGDLLESKLKRLAGIKDSGNILPGHGGMLDRFDSLLLAAPVCVIWFALWLVLFWMR